MPLKYSGKDKYDNAIFTTFEGDSSYPKLKAEHAKLAKLYPKTFLPIYASPKKFATLRIRQSPDLPEFKLQAMYAVKYSIRERAVGNKKSVFVQYVDSVMIAAAPIETVIDLDDMDQDFP